MCMIIYRPEGVVVPANVLADAARRNADGVGIMYYDIPSQTIVIRRSADSKAYLGWPELENPDIELGIHFRFGTHGKKDLLNVHPFVVAPWLTLMHNGILDLRDPDGELSDTGVLAHRVLPPLIGNNRDLHKQQGFQAALELIAGSYNKFLTLDDHGSFDVYNRGAWTRDSQGILYSSMPSHVQYSSTSYTRRGSYNDFGEDMDAWYSTGKDAATGGSGTADWRFPREDIKKGEEASASSSSITTSSGLILPASAASLTSASSVAVKTLSDGYVITKAMVDKQLEELERMLVDIKDESDEELTELAVAWLEQQHDANTQWVVSPDAEASVGNIIDGPDYVVVRADENLNGMWE